jgi:nicotinate-nucleotide adenylyltransferase
MALRIAAQAAAVRVGLLGGTFDPPHYGHLILAEVAREELNLGQVFFLPNGQPPHKAAPEVTPAAHRYVMTELACASHPRFFVSRAEMERSGPSYTLDTVRTFQQELGPAAQLFFLVGMDSVLEMPTWHEPERLLEEAQVIAAPRPGSEVASLEKAIGAEWAAKIGLLEMPLVGISATDLRQRVREGRSLRYLTPEPVIAYIAKHGLYRQTE